MTPPAAEQRLRVLVLTDHFKDLAGSEIVALQTALWFAARGDFVTMAANVAGTPIAAHAAGVHVTTDISSIDLSTFDLVWCQHDMLGLLPFSVWQAASACGVFPHVACVSLSPYEPYEHLDGLSARALSADLYANSPETADAVAAANRGTIGRPEVRVFHNAAPEEFWSGATGSHSPDLKSILLVSNHPPPELDACIALLQQRGIDVRRIGVQHERALVSPGDIAQRDAIVTIGKTAVYAIAQHKPVFLYDLRGGDGWLTRENFALNRYHNFSGRPHQRRAESETLADEITGGYPHAANEMLHLGNAHDLSGFHLDAHLAPLRLRAAQRRMAWADLMRRSKLALHVHSSRFRAHIEAINRKHQVLRMLRRQLEGSSV